MTTRRYKYWKSTNHKNTISMLHSNERIYSMFMLQLLILLSISTFYYLLSTFNISIALELFRAFIYHLWHQVYYNKLGEQITLHILNVSHRELLFHHFFILRKLWKHPSQYPNITSKAISTSRASYHTKSRKIDANELARIPSELQQ